MIVGLLTLPRIAGAGRCGSNCGLDRSAGSLQVEAPSAVCGDPAGYGCCPHDIKTVYRDGGDSEFARLEHDFPLTTLSTGFGGIDSRMAGMQSTQVVADLGGA